MLEYVYICIFLSPVFKVKPPYLYVFLRASNSSLRSSIKHGESISALRNVKLFSHTVIVPSQSQLCSILPILFLSKLSVILTVTSININLRALLEIGPNFKEDEENFWQIFQIIEKLPISLRINSRTMFLRDNQVHGKLN